MLCYMPQGSLPHETAWVSKSTCSYESKTPPEGNADLEFHTRRIEEAFCLPSGCNFSVVKKCLQKVFSKKKVFATSDFSAFKN